MQMSDVGQSSEGSQALWSPRTRWHRGPRDIRASSVVNIEAPGGNLGHLQVITTHAVSGGVADVETVIGVEGRSEGEVQEPL